MWQLTLKQRRRHSELTAQLDRIKRDPYLHVPEAYRFGENHDEDEKYKKVLESLKSVVEELHELEVTARESG